MIGWAFLSQGTGIGWFETGVLSWGWAGKVTFPVGELGLAASGCMGKGGSLPWVEL